MHISCIQIWSFQKQNFTLDICWRGSNEVTEQRGRPLNITCAVFQLNIRHQPCLIWNPVIYRLIWLKLRIYCAYGAKPDPWNTCSWSQTLLTELVALVRVARWLKEIRLSSSSRLYNGTVHFLFREHPQSTAWHVFIPFDQYCWNDWGYVGKPCILVLCVLVLEKLSGVWLRAIVWPIVSLPWYRFYSEFGLIW